MKSCRVLLIVLLVGLWSLSALAASPEGGVMDVREGRIFAPTNKAFGDPTDFKASALAGGNYLRYMQADFTEDNAGNGPAGTDPDDGGYGWYTNGFENEGTTYGNVWGVTANGLYQSYLLEADGFVYIAMRDAANGLVAATIADVTKVTSAPNITFLLNFASLPEVIAGTAPLALTSSQYRDAAVAIWDYDLATFGGGPATATALGQHVIDGRQPAYPNGLIAWDIALWVDALMKLDVDFPSGGYHGFANEMADLSHTNSFPGIPGDGIFEPDGFAKGYTDGDTDSRYDMYSLGVASLIRSFSLTGQHLDKIALLQGLLLDCQFANGSFSDHYGAVANDDAYAQDAAYAVWGLYYTDTPTTATDDAFYKAAVWLGSIQEDSGDPNTSGGFLDIDGWHAPEEGSECTAAFAMAFDSFSAGIGASLPTGGDLLMCSEDNLMTFSLDVNPSTPLVIGFEVVLDITGNLPSTIAFAEAATLGANFFDVTGTGPYSVNGSFYLGNGISADADLFTIFFDGLVEGAVDVSVVSYKLRGPDNVFIFGDVSGAGFVVDCTAPAAVTGIAAAPRHNKVDVSWAHADLGDVDHFEVYRGLWYNTTVGTTAYPEYDDVGAIAPTRPTGYGVFPTPAEWVPVDNGVDLITTLTYTDGDVAFTAGRGVYYYEVFAVDAAGNGSAPATTNDRATNYWLGDIVGVPYTGGDPATAPNGVVNSIDMNELSASFGVMGLSVGDAQYVLDVGPTDDWSRIGVPTTDSNIDFEDLMVFSMNFGVVTAAKANAPLSTSVDLAWVMNDDGSMALRLVNGTGLKGLRVQAASQVTHVSAGQLLDAQSELTFLKNVGTTLDASVAVMGVNNGFSGSGDLMVIAANSPIKAEDVTITARGIDNSELTVNLDKTSDTATPRVFALHANYPNPFNPMTKISFSLPEAQSVDLSVYSLDGRKVATLISGTQSAGLHEVVWMGKDDRGHTAASGTYFYRINAGPYSQVHKMTLMK